MNGKSRFVGINQQILLMFVKGTLRRLRMCEKIRLLRLRREWQKGLRSEQMYTIMTLDYLHSSIARA